MFWIKPEEMHYDWGNTALVNQFFDLGIPEGSHLAELWMGSHPRGPSRIMDPATGLPLEDLTLLDLLHAHPEYSSAPPSPEGSRRAPELGDDSGERLGNNPPAGAPNPLPFLFKILSAEKALSIQAHPSLEQARQGWERENAQGIDPNAPHRNYRDPNHKPECMYALSTFWALRGFRNPRDIARDLSFLQDSCPGIVEPLGLSDPAKALAGFLTAVLECSGRDLNLLLQEVSRQARETLNARGIDYTSQDHLGTADREYWPAIWTLRLMDQYPGDPGSLAPFYLRIFRLEPGQAVVLPAGVLHAYLQGIGLEAMANSDNVLRAGCTPKHVDIPELLRVVSFNEDTSRPVTPDLETPLGTGFSEFELVLHENRLPTPSRGFDSGPSAAILLGLEGEVILRYSRPKQGGNLPEGFVQEITLPRGRSVFIPPGSGSIAVSGQGRFARCLQGSR